MPSYIQYKKMMAVLDEDSDIESWITVNGNHIPIRKGQTKEEAVKSFVEKKQGKSGSGEGSASHGSGEYKKQESKSETKKTPALQKGQVKLHRDIDNRDVIIDPDGAYTFYKDGVKGSQNRSLKGQEGALKELGELGYKQDTKVGPFPKAFSEPKEDYKKLRDSFGSHYDKLYKSQYLDDKYEYLLGEWDKHIKNPEFKKKVQEFVEARGDFITSDREVKAFMLAAKENGLIPQENAAKKEPAKPAEAKNPNSALVSAVAKALNTTPADAETEIEGAAQHISDLMKAKDLRNGDVEETLLGLGVESDYAEEFMEWVSGAGKKTKAPKVKYVDAKKWNDPRSDPWYALYE